MKRVRVPELMDDPTVDPVEHSAALAALNRTNELFGVNRGLKRAVEAFGPLGELSVLDLGSGGGEFLAHLCRQAGRMPGARLIGLDQSAHSVSQAQRWHGDALEFIVGDARRIPLDDASVDVATCSLFLHHFDEDDVVRILAEMARVARRGVVVGDLSRSTLAWALTWASTRVLSRSRLFHVDGPRSVRAAFRQRELLNIARRAGLTGARARSVFPFRYILSWSKPENGNGRF